eukprot:1158201-Pelagomonas_calceolata.AAC.2
MQGGIDKGHKRTRCQPSLLTNGWSICTKGENARSQGHPAAQGVEVCRGEVGAQQGMLVMMLVMVFEKHNKACSS